MWTVFYKFRFLLTLCAAVWALIVHKLDVSLILVGILLGVLWSFRCCRHRTPVVNLPYIGRSPCQHLATAYLPASDIFVGGWYCAEHAEHWNAFHARVDKDWEAHTNENLH